MCKQLIAFAALLLILPTAFAQRFAPNPTKQVDIEDLKQQKARSVYPIMPLTEGQMQERYLQHQDLPLVPVPKQSIRFPKSISLLSYLTYNPWERNQGMCGNCYAWAATGALEMDLSYRFQTRDRLSVQFFNSCTEISACDGGWPQDVADFYNEAQMAIPWRNLNADWKDGNGFSTVPCEEIEKTRHYPVLACTASTIVNEGMSREATIAAIKAQLDSGKAVCFGFFLPTDADWNAFFAHWDNNGEDTYIDLSALGNKACDAGVGGHEVLCVGYTEDAWIMLNSWGEAGGMRPNGCFAVGPIDTMDYSAWLEDSGETFPMFYWDVIDTDFAQQLPMNFILPGGALLAAGMTLIRRRRRG